MSENYLLFIPKMGEVVELIQKISIGNIIDLMVPVAAFSAGVLMYEVYFRTPKIPSYTLLIMVMGLYTASVIYLFKTGKTPYESAIERLSS